MTAYNMICSSHDCTFTNRNTEQEGVEPFCPVCKSVLYWQCPECDRPITTTQAVYCSYCKEPIKEPAPEPEAGDCRFDGDPKLA